MFGIEDGDKVEMTFDDREKAFEDKFKHDEELRFRVEARRNKMLGRWAAEQMGLTGETAEVYAREVIESDLKEAGDDDVLNKVLGDFESKGVDVSAHRLRKRMDEFMEIAKTQVMKE
jgi:hypothetical protein